MSTLAQTSVAWSANVEVRFQLRGIDYLASSVVAKQQNRKQFKFLPARKTA